MTNSESKKINSGNLNPINVPDAAAFWISPYGKLSPVTLNKYHIDEILRHPLMFGFYVEQIKGIYDKYSEKMYDEEGIATEGDARGEIIDKLFKEGWIKIRKTVFLDESSAYKVELDRISEKVKDYLWAWAVGLIKEVSEGELDEEKKKLLIEEKRKAKVILKDESQNKEVTLGFLADDLLKDENDRFKSDRALLIVLEGAQQMLDVWVVENQRRKIQGLE